MTKRKYTIEKNKLNKKLYAIDAEYENTYAVTNGAAIREQLAIEKNAINEQLRELRKFYLENKEN